MRRDLYPEIFIASLAGILLEIAYTRIFSFKVYYYFTYLIIGIGLMGLGAGGVLVSVWQRLRASPPERVIAVSGTMGGLAVLVGYLLTAVTQLNASALSFDAVEVLKLAVIASLVTAPFVAVGVIVSTILASRADRVGRFYAADLVGAGLGCLLAIPLLELLDPPRTVLLSGLLLVMSGLRQAWSTKSLRMAGAGAGLLLSVLVVLAGSLPDPVVDRLKGFEDFRRAGLIETTRWNPVFRVDVANHPTHPNELFLLFHDGAPGSGMRRLDPEKKAFSHLANDSRRLPFIVMNKPAPRVLIIGSAGGHEVVASLEYGAGHVTGVELNSATLSLLRGEYASITGNLAENPKVTLINADGRSFLARTDQRYDLIWFVAPDSYAAMNASASGAFVLAESYLYTVEMLREAFEHLVHDGLLCAQFGEVDFERKPNRTVRFIATTRRANYLDEIPDVDERTLVSTAAGLPPFVESTVIVSKASLSHEQIEAFKAHVERNVPEGRVRYTLHGPPQESQVDDVVRIPHDLIPDWYLEHPYLVEPVYDESPFFWHFARFSDALFGDRAVSGGPVDLEDAVGERVLWVLLGVAACLGALFLFVPLWRSRKVFSAIPFKLWWATYFACLGLGFMFIEVAMIQKLTLVLGYPTRSLTVTLFSLLVSTGAGSLLSSRYTVNWEKAVGRLLCVLVILVALWLFATPTLIPALVGAPLAVRVVCAALLTAPFGLCLGGFLPLGVRAVVERTENHREAVAWAWAINAFASVIGSVLSAMLAMTVGFNLLIIGAPILYTAGILGLVRLSAPDVSPAR